MTLVRLRVRLSVALSLINPISTSSAPPLYLQLRNATHLHYEGFIPGRPASQCHDVRLPQALNTQVLLAGQVGGLASLQSVFRAYNYPAPTKPTLQVEALSHIDNNDDHGFPDRDLHPAVELLWNSNILAV